MSLGFLADGATRRDDVVAFLGEPSRRLNDSRIVTYKLSRAQTGFDVADRPTATGWEDATHSLVLVFDHDGVLRQHALVAVKGD